jgi:glycine/D-amino acid oxidase-like deaminating enzyme
VTLRSVWQDRHPRPTPADPGAADLGGPVDVAVVGAGLTGVTTALLLARAGLSVTVLEARHLGAVTTGGSTAKLSVLQGTRLSEIGRWHPAPVVRRYVEANVEGQAWVRRFCDDHGVAWQERPAVTFAHGSSGEASVRRELDAAVAAGLEAHWVDDPGLPFATAGGVRLEGQAQLDPVELLEALWSEAERHGARLVEGVRVRRVSGRDPVTVATDVGDVEAGRVVVATGMPILDRGAWFARMVPARSYGLAFETQLPAVDTMFLSADAPSRSLRDAPGTDGRPLLLVGGEGHTTGRGGSTAARLDALREWTLQWWPDAVETHAWSAQDYVPARQLPYAGPVLPGADHVLVAGGYAKWGMTNAVAAALALTAHMEGGSMPWAEVFSTHALRGARGLPKGAWVNAEVGLEMGRGWLRPLLGLHAPRAGDRSGVCTHLGGVVRWNDAERTWDCPLHGSRFDDATGAVLEGPATCGLRARD